MNLIVRVKIVPHEDVDAVLVNETFPSVSSMYVTDDVIDRHIWLLSWRRKDNTF